MKPHSSCNASVPVAALWFFGAVLLFGAGCGDDNDRGQQPTATPVVPTSTAAPTAVATSTATAVPTSTAMPTGVPTGTVGATATPTGLPTGTASATATPTGLPTGTASATATSTPIGVPTGTASTLTPTPTGTPVGEPAAPEFAQWGPYVVGTTTLDLGDRDIEVWYPVDPGEETGHEKYSYRTFDPLPDAIEAILPPHLNTVVQTDTYRNLRVSRDGPFPILTFSHGAGGYKNAYSGFLAGFASHGLIVASLDHLEWGLLAQVGLLPPGINREASEVVLAAIDRLVAASDDEASPLRGGVDASRVATAGHSAGGRAAFALPNRPEVRAMIGYATGSALGVVTDKPILLLVGEEDAGAARLEEAYDALSPPKRFVDIGRSGHNSFTDACVIIHGGNNFLLDLIEAGFPIPQDLLDQAIDGCRPENLAPVEFWKVAQHFTIAHIRAAFGIDDPPVGLGDEIATAFAGVTLRYRHDEGSNPQPTVGTGFVVSGFGSVVGSSAGEACPGGFNLGPVERQVQGLPRIAEDCMNPTASHDPDFKTLDGPGTVEGVDLDRTVSQKSSGGPCAHDDLVGPNGEPGLDLQLWRAVGCIRGFQAGEITDIAVDQAVRDGSMTILVEVQGADDWRNDDAVRVRVYGSADPPPIGADGHVLPYGTLSAHPDRRYWSGIGRGRIVDGVLTAGPMDVRVRLNIQIVASDLTFHDAFVRLRLEPDGTARGQIFGFEPIEELYDIYGRKAGQAGAAAIGYTCSGIYAALQSQADGDYDHAAGKCTSISVGYHFDAVPAFIAR